MIPAVAITVPRRNTMTDRLSRAALVALLAVLGFTAPAPASAATATATATATDSAPTVARRAQRWGAAERGP